MKLFLGVLATSSGLVLTYYGISIINEYNPALLNALKSMVSSIEVTEQTY